jgi:Fanconi-associated nuclease 1
VALGGPALAALCDALAADRKALDAGLPDLLLWRVEGRAPHAPFAPAPPHGLGGADAPELALPPGARVAVRFVEVKSPNDKLSDKQRVWLRILRAAGVDARVCRVLAA